MSDDYSWGNLGPQWDAPKPQPPVPDTLYHGTHHEVRDGEILPAGMAGRMVNFSLSDPGVAYATENEDTAWSMSRLAQGNYHRRTQKTPGRTRVHVVEPKGPVSVGAYHPASPHYSNENLSEWVAPAFKIKDTIDTQPGRQGTLNLNWNQFSKHPNRHVWNDALNHPEDDDIEHGHEGGEMNRQNLLNWKTGGPDTHRNFQEIEGSKIADQYARDMDSHPALPGMPESSRRRRLG